MLWTGPNNFTSTLKDVFITGSATPAHSGVYTATYTDTDGCTKSLDLTLTVNPAASSECNPYNCAEDHLDFNTHDLNTGLYQAIETITATNDITNGRNVDYRAATFILMNAGFEVELGAEFSAEIAPCVLDRENEE